MGEKMTLSEATAKRVKAVRRDPWAPRGRLVFEYPDDKYTGVWARVHDGATDAECFEPPKVCWILLPEAQDRVWEEWLETSGKVDR